MLFSSLYYSCCLHCATFTCSVFLAFTLFPRYCFTVLAPSVLIFLFRFIVCSLSVLLFLPCPMCLDPSLSHLSFASLLSFYSFLFFNSVSFFASSYLCGFKVPLSLTMPWSLAECSANYCTGESKLSLTRSCIVYGSLVHDTCNTSNRSALMEVPELSLWKSHHLTCSCACWDVKLAHRSCKGEVFVAGQESDPGGNPRRARASFYLAPGESSFTHSAPCTEHSAARSRRHSHFCRRSSRSSPLLSYFGRSSRSPALS